MLRKIFAVLLFFIGLLGLAVSVAGIMIGSRAIDGVGDSLDSALELSSESLGTAGETLTLTKETIGQIKTGLDTVGDTALSVAQTLTDTQPLLDSVTIVAAGEIPQGLEAIQDAIPGVEDAAGAIDDTLRTLSSFRLERSVFGIPINFDLGIDYNPEVALDESVVQIGDSLEGMPDSLRALRSDMDVASDNLKTVSSNIQDIASDLDTIGSSIDQFEPLVDDYIRLVSDVQESIDQAREGLSSQLTNAKLIVTLLFVWVGVNQLVPLYLSWDIFTSDREKTTEEAEPTSNLEPDDENKANKSDKAGSEAVESDEEVSDSTTNV